MTEQQKTAKRLKDAMKAQGMSKYELSRRSGVARSTIYCVLAGEGCLTSTIQRLFAAVEK